jgi:hypothetical protein
MMVAATSLAGVEKPSALQLRARQVSFLSVTAPRLCHSGVARRSVALCNPFPIVISRRPRRAIASDSSRQRSRRGTGNDDGDLERRDDRGVG